MRRLRDMFQSMADSEDKKAEEVRKSIKDTDLRDAIEEDKNFGLQNLRPEDETDREKQEITEDDSGPVEDILEDIKPAPKKSSTKPSHGFDDRI